MPKLTKRIVDGADIRAGEYFMWCDELPGFGVRIYPSGKRGYLIQYRAGGRTRRAKIGLHGRLTVDEARIEAKVLLAAVAKGGDPAEDRATRRKSMTVRELCEAYREAAGRGLIMGKRGLPKKPLTLASDFGRIDGHIVPLLGTRLVRDLAHADIARFVRDVAVGKTASVAKTGRPRGKSILKGGRGAAARTVGLLGGILSFAVSKGVIAVSPAIGVKKPAYVKRTVRLTPADYGALGLALDLSVTAGMNPTALAAVRLLALTGCRKGEIVGLRWTEVDALGHAFRLQDSKEGASTRPIGAAAFAVLAELTGTEKEDEAEWVLPGERRNLPYGGLKSAWPQIRDRAGLTNATMHTLRHSFASVAGDLGYSESTIAAMLGHAAGSVTGRYTHHLDSVLIAAADRVAEAVRGYLAGGLHDPRAEPGPVHSVSVDKK